MALNLAAASNQYVQNAAPLVLDYPFSIGIWCNLTAVGSVSRTLFALSDTGSTANHLSVAMSSTEEVQISAQAGGTTNSATAAVALSPDRWAFVVGRFISSTNRRITTLGGDGSIASGSTSTARAPTGLDTMTIGIRVSSAGTTLPWNGRLGEWWLADADAAIDSAADMPDAIMRQLAYGGPFSVPYLVPRILEYRSFRVHPTIDDPTETYHRGAPAAWTAVNGPTIGAHCPLPYWYRNTPGDTSSLLMV